MALVPDCLEPIFILLFLFYKFDRIVLLYAACIQQTLECGSGGGSSKVSLLLRNAER